MENLQNWERELIALADDSAPIRDVTADENAAMGSGYTHCACRDCMDTTVSSDTSTPELCELCAKAGCEAATALVADLVVGTECQRDDAYGEA